MQPLIKKITNHISKNKHWYGLGTFGVFAIIKSFILLAGFIGGLSFLSNHASAAAETFCMDNNGALDIPVAECETLVNLYNTTEGDNWKNQTDGKEKWFSSPTVCGKWYGVSCDGGHVIKISLGNNNLLGVVPSLSGLTNLNQLYINNNQLTDIDLSDLTNMTTLNLGGNLLNSIDLSELSQLQYLDLYNNQLTDIDLTGLTKLTTLNLGGNLLNSIDVSGLSQLITLELSSNQLTAIDLSDLTQLQSLNLGQNLFTGINLSGLTNLNSLNLYNNQLTDIDLTGLTKLTQLYLKNNKLYNLPNNDILYNVKEGTIDHNYLDVKSIENDNGLVDILDQKFNNGYGWRIQYLPTELSLSGNIVSLSDDMFSIDLQYYNNGSRTSFDNVIYYDMINGVTISSNMVYSTGRVDKLYPGFGDPCFDELYNSGTGPYISLFDTAAKSRGYENFIQLVFGELKYTGEVSGVGKAFIDNITQNREHNFGPITDRRYLFLNFDGEFTDLAAAPNCGTGGRNAYIFDLGDIPSGSGGTIVITGSYNGGYRELENKIALLSTNNLSIDIGTGEKDVSLSYSGGKKTEIISSGKGGKDGGLSKDVCANMDCSSSYYDHICGVCPDKPKEPLTDKLIDQIHGAPELQGNIAGSPYSTELNTAYLRAYNAGITSMPTIQQANIEGNLIRSHMAKMMVEFASLFDKEINTGVNCAFTDMSKESNEMKYYATVACQLGLMGLDDNGNPAPTFNPTNTVTRAQFGTVLSRLLYGNLNNAQKGTQRYKQHLEALKNAGIMKKNRQSKYEGGKRICYVDDDEKCEIA